MKKRYGWHPGKRLLAWLGEAVAEKLGDPDTTFADVRITFHNFTFSPKEFNDLHFFLPACPPVCHRLDTMEPFYLTTYSLVYVHYIIYQNLENSRFSLRITIIVIYMNRLYPLHSETLGQYKLI